MILIFAQNSVNYGSYLASNPQKNNKNKALQSITTWKEGWYVLHFKSSNVHTCLGKAIDIDAYGFDQS